MKKEEGGASGGWMPDFTPEERAALVKLNGEEWVREEEKLIRYTRELMDFFTALPP